MRPPHIRNLVRTVEVGTDWSQRVYLPLRAPPNQNIDDLLSKPTWSVRSLMPPPVRASSSTSSPSPLFSSPTEPTDTTLRTNADGTTDHKTTSTPPTPSGKAPPSLEEEITPAKLHHLLRLSALPLPRTKKEEASMLATLRSQIHFVRAIQAVDTSNVKPLVAIRDETSEAVTEQTVKLADLKPWLDLEEKVGRNGTLRRRKIESERVVTEDGRERLRMGEMTWDAFELGVGGKDGGGRRRGRWFVVKKRNQKKQATAPPAAAQDLGKAEIKKIGNDG